MRDLILRYPIKSVAVRKTFVRLYDGCPECSGFLDTGAKCMICGFDATELKEYQAPAGAEIDEKGRRLRRGRR
jgi:hypothetical protein